MKLLDIKYVALCMLYYILSCVYKQTEELFCFYSAKHKCKKNIHKLGKTKRIISVYIGNLSFKRLVLNKIFEG